MKFAHVPFEFVKRAFKLARALQSFKFASTGRKGYFSHSISRMGSQIPNMFIQIGVMLFLFWKGENRDLYVFKCEFLFHPHTVKYIVKVSLTLNNSSLLFCNAPLLSYMLSELYMHQYHRFTSLSYVQSWQHELDTGVSLKKTGKES